MKHTSICCKLLTLTLLLSALTGCGSKEPEKTEKQIFAMDTVMTLTAYGEAAGPALDAAAAQINETARLLETLPPIVHFEEEVELDEAIKPGAFEVTKDGAVYEVTGTSMERLLDSVNFDDEESMNWFHRTLRRWGVIDALRQAGAKEGDTVRIIDMEFDFVE